MQNENSIHWENYCITSLNSWYRVRCRLFQFSNVTQISLVFLCPCISNLVTVQYLIFIFSIDIIVNLIVPRPSDTNNCYCYSPPVFFSLLSINVLQTENKMKVYKSYCCVHNNREIACDNFNSWFILVHDLIEDRCIFSTLFLYAPFFGLLILIPLNIFALFSLPPI